MSLSQRARLNHLRPYATEAEVRRRSNMADTGSDDFRDLFLADFIEANKRVARRQMECLRLRDQQTELLGRGVQSSFDPEERPDVIMEAAIGYAGAVGVSCMDEVAALNEKFGELPKKVEDLDSVMTDLDGRYIGLVERQDAYEESTVKVLEKLTEKVTQLEFDLQQEKARVRGLVDGRRDQLRMLNSFRNTITGMEGRLMILENWRSRGGGASARSAPGVPPRFPPSQPMRRLVPIEGPEEEWETSPEVRDYDAESRAQIRRDEAEGHFDHLVEADRVASLPGGPAPDYHLLPPPWSPRRMPWTEEWQERAERVRSPPPRRERSTEPPVRTLGDIWRVVEARERAGPREGSPSDRAFSGGWGPGTDDP
jgi:hypothetical protein